MYGHVESIPSLIAADQQAHLSAYPWGCGCRGSGWFLSDWDTWHRCPAHARPGQEHPEAHYGDDPVALDPVDGRPIPPPAQDVERASRAWWKLAIRAYAQNRLAHFCWSWGTTEEEYQFVEDRIRDWSTD